MRISNTAPGGAAESAAKILRVHAAARRGIPRPAEPGNDPARLTPQAADPSAPRPLRAERPSVPV